MSVAYSAFFQWDKLSDAQKGYIYAMLKAECNYELGRNIPTGYAGDTKAEENGWEAMFEAPALGDANHAHIQYDAAALDEMLRNYGRNNDDLAPANVGIEATAPNPFR
jgi:hypothetical protein